MTEAQRDNAPIIFFDDVDSTTRVFDEFASVCYGASASKGFHENDDLGLRLHKALMPSMLDDPDGVALLTEAEVEHVINKVTAVLGQQWDELEDTKRLLLSVGELIEAHEEIRSGWKPSDIYYVCTRCNQKTGTVDGRGNTLCCEVPGKPEGVPIEIADVIIRLGDYAGTRDIPLGFAVAAKLRFNATRPRKHGRNF